MTRRLATVLLAVCCLSGCATSATQIGQTAGGLLGSVLVPGVGTGLGSLVGTVAGLVVDGQLDKVREKKERVELSQQLQQRPAAAAIPRRNELVGSPAGEPAGEPARVWVDEAMKNGSVMAGHFEERVIP